MNKKKGFFTNCKAYISFIFSGLLLFASFPKLDFYSFAWVALTPALISLYYHDLKFALKAGLLMGMVYFFGTIYWIYHALYIYGSMPFVLSILLVALLSLYLSLYIAVFCFLYSFTLKKSYFPSLLTAPFIWTTLEFIRSYALTGFPWSSLGYSQYKLLPMIQIADITGIYGISFLLVAFNGFIADLHINIIRKIRNETPIYLSLSFLSGSLCLFLVLILVFLYGFFRLHEERSDSSFKAAIIQGNIEQDKKWDKHYQKAVLGTYKELTSLAVEKTPYIVIWPETALPFIFKEDHELTNDLITFQRELGAYLLFGSILIKRDQENEQRIKNGNWLSNSAVLLDKNGNVTYIYDKIHLVPFGEYVPLRNILFFIDKLVYGFGDYYPGNRYLSAVTPFGSFATLICYEIIFPGMVRKFFSQYGGSFIVTITNDAWFGDTHGPYQHFSMAVFRAVENRKPVIRAANAGISGFIDSNGRITETSRLFERTYLLKEVKRDETLTFYTKYGDAFSYLCIIITVALLLSLKRL